MVVVKRQPLYKCETQACKVCAKHEEDYGGETNVDWVFFPTSMDGMCPCGPSFTHLVVDEHEER